MMKISLLQAFLCGIIYWLSVGNLPFIGLWTLQKPLVCGTLVGLILGQPVQGAVIGGSINLMYIGFVSAGGSMPADISLAGILGTAYAICGGIDAQVALTLAVPIGILGTIIWTGRMTFDSFFVHMADAYIKKEEYHKIWIANVLLPQILCAIVTVPLCTLAIYYGSSSVQGIVTSLSGSFLQAMKVVGGILPCVGIALTMRYIFKGESRVFFFVGFMIAAYSDFSLLTIGIISLLISIIYMQLKRKEIEEESEDEDVEDIEKVKLIPKSALFKAWLIWETFPQTCYNYERMMGQHMAHMFSVLVDYIYPDNPVEKQRLMKREVTFYNTHVEFGSCVTGMAIALEEQKANNDMISDELIKNLKTSFMGTLAGIGDTLWQGIFIPMLLVCCVDITMYDGGNLFGVVLYVIVTIITACIISYFGFMFGYQFGGEAIVKSLETGNLKKLIKTASVMGCMVMGSLVVKYVYCTCGIAFTFSSTTFNLQTDLFDKICPCILPLGITLLNHVMLSRFHWTTKKCILLCLIVGILGSIAGILVP